MKLVLKNGSLLENNELVNKNILIDNGIIKEINTEVNEINAEIIDLDGKFISPGFVDVHVHLREPGMTHKETIETGTMSAAKGGYTLVAAMPNVKPTPDSVENLNEMISIIEKNAKVRVIPYASITKNLSGRGELVDFNNLHEKVIGFTNDGLGIQEAGLMYEGMLEAKRVNKPIVAHCEDESLLYGGYVHEGEFSKKNGHKGILSVSESVHIARDALLAETAECKYHVCHISTKESVRVVRDNKNAGIKITAEVAPHHLLLVDEDVVNTNFKMNPPLRSKLDREACIKGLLDGTIDIIATDHAPHTEEEKSASIERAPFGIVGLETAFPLMYTYFVKESLATLGDLVNWMSTKPCELFDLPYGKLEAGAVADITVIDLEKKYKIDMNEFVSKGKNTPFDGWEVYGETILTMVNGEVVFKKS